MDTVSCSEAKMPTSFVIPSDDLLVDGSKTASKSANKPSKKDFSHSSAKKEDKSPSMTAAKNLESIPLIPAGILVSAMASRRSEFEKEAQKKIIVKEFSWPNPQNSYSSIPLTELKPLTFSMMKLGQRLLGYLLCRIISPAARQVCVQLVVEDVEGNAQFVSLYHHPGTLNASPTELDTLFPVGMILAIKNPSVKRAANNSPFTHLRIDVPTEVISVESGNEILMGVVWSTGERPDPLTATTADEWKAVGDSHFKAHQFFAAAVAYTRSLKVDPSNYKAKMNRSFMHLRLDNTEACLEDIEQLLKEKGLALQDRTKTILRKGLALYAEMRYTEAKEAFLECFKIDSKCSVTQYLNQCNARLRESSTGNYDWESLYEKAMVPGSRLDIAPFRGSVEIRNANNLKGQAVYATKPIEIGQLLVVEKAFASSFREDLTRDYHNIISEDDTFSTRLIHLRQVCVDKLAYSPRLQPLFLRQWAGNPDTAEYYDWTQLSSKNQLAEAEIFSQPHPVNVPQIHRIATINSFLTWFPEEVKFEATYQAHLLGAAIFPFCAGFANECYANAHWECWGDVIIVRASCDIGAGEEIKISHGPPARYMARRAEMAGLAMWNGSKLCDCRLCSEARGVFSLDQVDSPYFSRRDLQPFDENARERLCRYAEQTLDDQLAAESAVLLLKVYQQRPRTEFPNPEEALAWLRGSCLVREGLLEEFQSKHVGPPGSDQRIVHTIKLIERAVSGLFSLGLKIKGFDGIPAPVRSNVESESLLVVKNRLPFSDCGVLCLILAQAQNILSDHPEVDNWMRAAVWLENMTRGGGIPLFRVRYGKILKILGAFAEESLSRIEKGEPSPRYGGVRPGSDGEFTGRDSVMFKMKRAADGIWDVIAGP